MDGENLNMLRFAMSHGGNKKCHPTYFKSKQLEMWKNFKQKQKHGARVVMHLHKVTFTMVKDSSNFHLEDNDLDYETITSQVVRRFNKKHQGSEHLKRLSKVIFFFISLET